MMYLEFNRASKYIQVSKSWFFGIPFSLEKSK